MDEPTSTAPVALDDLSEEDLQDVWPLLSPDDRLAAFSLVPRVEAEDFFLRLPAADQAALLLGAAGEPSAGRGCACCRPTTRPT